MRSYKTIERSICRDDKQKNKDNDCVLKSLILSTVSTLSIVSRHNYFSSIASLPTPSFSSCVLIRLKLAHKVFQSWVGRFTKITITTTYIALVINPKITLDEIPSDPDDNCILECAIKAQADIIISTDTDLLKLKRFRCVASHSSRVCRTALAIARWPLAVG